MGKPKVGIFGLTSCAGDQLAIINCEDELLDIVGAVELKSFVMGQSENDDSDLDVALVEGAVVTEEDEETLRRVRENSKILVAIGTCASWGGIPASGNVYERKDLYREVYGTEQDLFKCGKMTLPLKEIVRVDFFVSGCPIEKDQILRTIGSLLHGELPLLPTYPVCTECRFKENRCLLVETGALCCGPITRAGCGARCPSHSLPCKGCRGPVDEANIASEFNILKEKGWTARDVVNAFRTFSYATEIPELKKETVLAGTGAAAGGKAEEEVAAGGS